MPRRHYKLFAWKEGEIIDDRLAYVEHDKDINVLGIEENSGDGGKYLLEIPDNKNLDNPLLFAVTINVNGKITDFKDFTDFRVFSNIKVKEISCSKEVECDMECVVGDDLGETLYTIKLEHKRYISKTVEFELKVSPKEKLSYIQEPPRMPWQTADEEDA